MQTLSSRKSETLRNVWRRQKGVKNPFTFLARV